MPVSIATHEPAVPQPSYAGTGQVPAVPEQVSRARRDAAGHAEDSPEEREQDMPAEETEEASSEEEPFLAGYYLG